MVALASDTGTVHADATAVKWGGSSGTALTKLAAGVAIGSFGNLSQWGLVAPANQSSTSFASWAAAPDEIFVQAVSYTGVDQVTPLRNSGVPNTNSATGQTGATVVMTVTVTNTQAGDVCVVVFHWADNGFHTPVASVAGSNVLRSHNEQSDTGCAIVEFVATGASTVVTCTLTPTIASNIDWGGSGVALVTASGAASARQVRRFPNRGTNPKNYGARTIGFKQGISTAAAVIDIASTGVLSITGAGSLASSVGTLAAAGALSITGAALLRATGTVAGAGALVITGTAAMTSTGTLTAAGSMVIVGAAAATAIGSLASAGTLVINGSATLPSANDVASAGSLVIVGAASATAVGTLASAGALVIGGTAALTATGTIASAGTLVINGASDLTATSANDIASAGSLVIVGAGTLSAQGTLAAAGNVVITGAAFLDDGSVPVVPQGGGGGGSGGKWIEKSTALRTVRRRKRKLEEPTVEIVSFVQPAVIEPISITPVDISRLADSLTSAPIADWANRLVSDQRLRQSIDDEADKLAELQQEEAEALLVLMIALDE